MKPKMNWLGKKKKPGDSSENSRVQTPAKAGHTHRITTLKRGENQTPQNLERDF